MMIPMRFLVAGILAAVLTAGCQTVPIPGLSGRVSDEQQIAAVLDDVHRAMEARRVSRVMSHVSEDYQDAQGRDYAVLRDYVNHIAATYRDIRITRATPRVDVQGDRARVLDAFGTLAQPANPAETGPLNIQGQVVLDFVREDGVWKIVEWGPLQ